MDGGAARIVSLVKATPGYRAHRHERGLLLEACARQLGRVPQWASAEVKFSQPRPPPALEVPGARAAPVPLPEQLGAYGADREVRAPGRPEFGTGP